MSFAAAIERVNGAVIRHLSTHQAVLDNVEVSGIFDNGYREALGAIGVQSPFFTLPSTSCIRAVAGTSRLRVVGVGAYTVEAIEPDGTGVTTLRLRRADA